MAKNNIIKIILLLFSLFIQIIKSQSKPEIKNLTLNVQTKGSLDDNSYHFYKLTLNLIDNINTKILILRVDEDKSNEIDDNSKFYFSDPDLYVSQENEYPKNEETSTWYCNEFGNDIVAISKENINSYNNTFYISVYCKKKCNYILNSYMDVSYKLSPNTIYGFHILPKKSMVYEFKTRNQDFEHLTVQLMGITSDQYNVYINREIPSSSKSYVLESAWSNGYSYDLYKDSEEYCTNCTFFILVKALEQHAVFRILLTYRGKALFINKRSSLFDIIKSNKNMCYYYPMDNFPAKDSLIMNFFLFGGSMIAKINGFDNNTNVPYSEIINSKDTYEIIGDRVLIFSHEQIEEFKNKSIDKNFKYFHFCLYSKQKSSYLLGLHYSSYTQFMQGLNYLNIGQSIKDYLPLNQVTKYKLFDVGTESNIKISLEVLQGKPKLYFMFETFPFIINKNLLAQYKYMGLILQPNAFGDKQSIFIPNEKNKCHQRSILSSKPGVVNKKPCVTNIIIECPVVQGMDQNDIKNDCIYKLSSIADKSKQPIKQKTTYRGLLGKDDYNDFLFTIDDADVVKFTIVLNTVSGELKLSLYKIDGGEENKVLLTEKNNRDFLPKIINVQNTDDMIKENKNLKGKYLIRVYSNTFSYYALYFYTTGKNSDKAIDVYSIDLNLINGQMIQDFFDNKIYKVYNYEINEGKFKDIRITVTQRNLDLNIFIYDNVNKIEYEFNDREQSYLKDTEIMQNYDKIINFKNYLWTNLYGAKQIIIPYSDLMQKVRKDKTLLFIVVAKKYHSSKNKNEISFLNQNTFYLGVTNNIVPLNLYENIPHQVTFNKMKNFSEQKYLFIHSDNTKKLSFAINVIAGVISFQIEIKRTKIIFYRNDYIKRNEFVSISPENLYKYSQNTGCEMILTISQVSQESPTYMIFAHSNDDKPLQLIPGVLIQNQIQAGEYHFYILDFNPKDYKDLNKFGNILMRYRGGKAELYMNFYSYDVDPEIQNFPNENNYDYIGESTYAGKILHLDKDLYEKCLSNYSPIDNANINENNNNITRIKNNQINCRFFITVKGKELSFYTGTRIEYSLFYTHSVLEISQGVPYTSKITAGEINYFKFAFDSNTKGIYITLYSALGDADMYINYGNNLPSFNNYIWRSSQSQMDSIFIDKNDNFFVDNKKTSLEGLYTIMIYGYTNSTYTLTVSQGQHKIIQLVPGTPSICKVDAENKEKLCYFRVENFANSKKVLEEDAGGLSNIIQKSTQVVDKDVHIVFSTKFLYGDGHMYVRLFKKTETEINLEDFPNEKRYDFSNEILFRNFKNSKRNFLKVDINKDNENLSAYSMLLLTVKCTDICLFEMNSAKIEYETNFQFIDIGRENLFYINTQKEPLLLSFLYNNKDQMNYELFSFTGNAEVKIFTNESYFDQNNVTKFEFNHISMFKIEKNVPYFNYFKQIGKKNQKQIKEVYMQIVPEQDNTDLGFYVKLNYENEWTKIENIGKAITYQLNSNTFNGYVDIYSEYENIILSVKSDDPKLTANVYVTINEVSYLGNKRQEFNYPTNQSYTYSGKTNFLTSTVSIKIDTPKNNNNNNYRIFYKVELTSDFSERNPNLAKTISVLVTPLVNNFQRVEANPYTIYFNSQNAKSTKSLFDLKRVDNNDDIYVIEISSCKGQFDANLLSQINYFSEEKADKKVQKVEKKFHQGRMVLTGYNLKEENYYLEVLGNNAINDNDNNLRRQGNSSNEVEFLLYYFTSNNKNYVYSNIQSYINPITLKNGDIKLETSKIQIKDINGKLNEIKNMDLSYKLFISTTLEDFSYMSSLCYLSKMENVLPKGIKTYTKDNEIYVSGLKSGVKYFTNIIIRNPISGELITFTPTIIEVNKSSLSWYYLIIPILVIIVLAVGVYYYRTQYLVTKAVLNYERNDIRNMATLPYGSGNNDLNSISAISQASKNTTQYLNLDESKI